MVIRYLLLLFLSAPAFADWQSTDDSKLEFEASFEGSPLPGEFPEFAVQFSPENAELRVTINVARADLGDDDMNAVLFDAAWFGTEHATAVFEATSVEPSDDGFTAEGNLTLKGVTSPVTVPITWSEVGDTASMSGEFVLNRTAFEVGTGEWSTGDSIALEVKVRFEVALTR